MNKPVRSIPEGLDMLPISTGVIIRRGWLGWGLIPLLVFTLVWDGFLSHWYSLAFAKEDIPLMLVLFPLGHVAVGVYLSYFCLASIINRSIGLM